MTQVLYLHTQARRRVRDVNCIRIRKSVLKKFFILFPRAFCDKFNQTIALR